jgi:type III pantothenate kinase
MLLAIDVGNTNITFGVFDGNKLKATWRSATGVHRVSDEYASFIINMLRHREIPNKEIKDAVLCGVVPPLVTTFDELFKNYFDVTPLVVGAGVKTGIRICMDNPREVGADRVVNAVGAYKLYGGPAIVIDIGTAITFDTVSKEGDYLGGAIAPGIAIAMDALFNRTAALPRVDLTYPKKAIGTNTVSAMQSGIFFGYVGLIEGVVAKIKEEMDGDAKVIATGGYADLLAEQTKAIQIVDRDITLVGLRYIYEMNRS